MTTILPAVLVFLPFGFALLSGLIGMINENARDYFADFGAIIEFIIMTVAFITLYPAVSAGESFSCVINEICGMGLKFTFDGFRLVYGLVAALMWMMTTILSRQYFAHHENRTRFYVFMFLTLGATMGVFLSSNLFTTFIFFEIMSFTSYVWVAQEETKEALRAAETYLGVAVIGGLVMLMGVFILYNQLGTLEMSELFAAAKACENRQILYLAGACVTFGFAAKAGAFPVHIWLPKAHPVAPAPASALLSGILTKSGIFGIIVMSFEIFRGDVAWGKWILALGVLTMFGGAMLAVFSVDLKRTLACSSMSQVGFILVGLGTANIVHEEQFLAGHGSMLHMVNHSLIKLVLFMAAGVVYMNTHSLDLNRIKGWGRKKPLIKIIFLIGALAIGGIPMFSGYVSKTLLHEGLLLMEFGYMTRIIEIIFLFSGGLTLAYMTKLFVAIFVEKNDDGELQKKYDAKKNYMNFGSGFALTGSALVLLVWGLFPHQTMDKVAVLGEKFFELEESGHTIHYFSFVNLKGAIISVIIGALVYIFIIRGLLMKNDRYVNLWPKWWDLENAVYRPIILKVIPAVLTFVCRICDSFIDLLVLVLRKTLYKDSSIPPVRKPRNLKRQYLDESIKIIERSISYGFLLFGIGLMMTVLYLMIF
ncbi:MAG: complex I subunit 5 family protein [Clostridia bacterium]|nr:complex I subunit 5 family protein [Clostridia bacterium]